MSRVAVALAPAATAADARATVAPLALAAAGGGLYALGYLGFAAWPCLLVFLVPWWTALDAAPRAAARAGAVFGLVAYAGGFAWLWRLVAVFLAGRAGLGALLWAGYGAWFAAGFVGLSLAFVALRRRGWGVGVAGVAPLVLLEWLQPQLFPVNAGSALVTVPALMQPADVGGPLLLTALVGGANATAWATCEWLRRRRATPWRAWAAAGTVLLAVLGWGRLRAAQLDAAIATAPALRVGIVQANLGLLEKRTQGIVGHREHVAETRALLADGPLDLVVWPETAYVRGIRRPLPVSGKPVREDLDVPLLFGASGVEEEGGRRRVRNSAFLVGADGMIRDVYDKNLLIPFGEYLPLARLLPGLGAWFPAAQSFGAADDTPPLHLGPWRIATPICYEAARGDFVRAMVRRARPHLLVTLANDAWFGDSQEPWIHLALVRLRAVEHRRFVVRATNSGVSAVIDPQGRLVVAGGLGTRERLRAVVHPLEGETPYDRLGDWPGWAALAVVAAAFARRRRAVEGSQPPHTR